MSGLAAAAGAASHAQMADISERTNGLTPSGDSAKLRARQHSPASSPLKLFVRAKTRINAIYNSLENYVLDAIDFVNKLPDDENLITTDELAAVRSFEQKVKGIKTVLGRDRMKVVFFGRTSNGKSSVINAMLRDKVLPSGMGHTTSCFLQVQGSDSDDCYVTVGDSTDRLSVQSIGQLGNALHKSTLAESSVVLVHWPRQRCHLLRNDVILVDSPGIDVSQGLDEWIDAHCLDADVFVLVANSESTIMQTEKKFFHKVATRLSKPNVFVLQNRWDQPASEPEFLQVRQQHTERSAAFLVDELRVVASRVDAERRVFFVSAKECLLQRLADAQVPPVQPVYLADGHLARYAEFEEFERRFEECISQSAVATKFRQHSQRAKNINSELQSLMDNVLDRATRAHSALTSRRQQLQQKLDDTRQQLFDTATLIGQRIVTMTDDIEHQVSTSICDEIRRLSALVHEFDAPFQPDQLTLKLYKKQLHSYVEAGLDSNLRKRLSDTVASGIEVQQHDMLGCMRQLVPANKRKVLRSLLPPRREPFQVFYRFNCDSLCKDFQEDIAFRFSLGISSLMNRFLGAGGKMSFFGHNDSVSRSSPGSPAVLSSSGVNHTAAAPFTPGSNSMAVLNARSDLMAGLSRSAVASLASQGTVSGLILTGMVLSRVGWRLISVSLLIYGSLYAFERLTYTTAAQRRRFKQQYVRHATHKLRLIVDLTSSNCSHQVQQELSSTLSRLQHFVQQTLDESEQQLRELDSQISRVKQLAAGAKTLRNKASYVSSELGVFADTFLSDAN